MKAINRYIIVDRIKTEPKKVAGLIMTDETDQDNRYIKAKMETQYITINMLDTTYHGKMYFTGSFVMVT